MIVDFYDKKDFLRKSNVSTVFICGFDLLYQYKQFSLGKLKDFPGVKNIAIKKKFGHNTCRMFTSKRYLGKLFIISNRASEPGNKEKIDEKINNLKKWIDEIYFTDEGFKVFRIDLDAFVGCFSKKYLLKLLKILSDSSKKFEIYC